MKDLKTIHGKINTATQKTATTVKNAIDDKKKKAELDRLKPIFEEDINGADFMLPKLICVSNMDKKYQDSEVCNWAIGYRAEYKDLLVITIFKEYIDKFGLTFYPNIDSEVYYMNPTDSNNYIALEDYFDYLKEARVNELKQIADKLGAKYFKVTLMEEKKKFSKKEKIWKQKEIIWMLLM